MDGGAVGAELLLLLLDLRPLFFWGRITKKS